ncbi:transcript cleavage factor [Gammaproteobacteria bacterium]|nr:transcript cleavage factor [Gammaproteobacteria bacterium]
MIGNIYITSAGRLRLQTELDYLWREKRPEVTRAVSEAAALGDRSENAEYIYGKKQLREIDRRIRFLSKRLEVLKVVSELPSDQSKIFFGAWIELEDDTGLKRWVRIVGSDEFDFDPHYISINSPVARALLKKCVDDQISLKLELGQINYLVLTVQYASPIF